MPCLAGMAGGPGVGAIVGIARGIPSGTAIVDCLLYTSKSLADLDIAMVMVTHEMAVARDISDRVVFMADGVIVESPFPARFLWMKSPEL